MFNIFSDIIDVSAIPTHIEQIDYIDRVKLYQKRLMSVHLSHPNRNRCLLKDLPFPERNLSETSLLLADMKMVSFRFFLLLLLTLAKQ